VRGVGDDRFGGRRRVTNGLRRVKPGSVPHQQGKNRAGSFTRLLFFAGFRYTSAPMSIRKGGGDWEPMLLGIEPRHCKVCKEGLYRNKTFFSGGWSRCSLCDEFVHYSCLASGKVSFLKARPRVCKTCRAAKEDVSIPSVDKDVAPVAVGS
jgi:hypothetical protein